MDEAERFVRDCESFEKSRTAWMRGRRLLGEPLPQRLLRAAGETLRRWFRRPEEADPYSYVGAPLVPKRPRSGGAMVHPND